MPTEGSTVIRVLLAVATFPVVFDLLVRAFATVVSASTTQTPLPRLLRTPPGPVTEADESPRHFVRRLAYFWFKIAAALTCVLVIIDQVVVWTRPEIADGVTYGAFVYVIGPLLVVTCLVRSLLLVINSF